MPMPAQMLATLALVALLSPLAAAADWKDALTHDLETLYPKTEQARFEMNQVTKAGVVLLVQKENIQAEPVHNFGSFASKVKDGEVLAPGGAGAFFSRSNTRILKPGDKVYVTGIGVHDDRVDLTLLTFDTYDVNEKGSTKPTRMRSVLQFQIAKDQLATMDAPAVKRVVDPILALASASSTTKTIELGQTIEQVETMLGKPASVAKLGPKTIYTYPTMKVIFMEGKVSDVQ